MEYRKIDLASYPRRKHFEYFKALAYPYTGLTANVDVTALKRYTAETGNSFFLSMMFAAAKAANRIPEFRMRIREDGIIEYPNCGTSHILLLENNTYCYCNLYYEKSYAQFIPYAIQEQEKWKRNPSIEDDEETDALYFVSAIPWVHYTQLVQAVPCTQESNPRISFGKYELKEGRLMMPLTVLVHHALIDGFHIGLFYQYVGEEILQILAN